MFINEYSRSNIKYYSSYKIWIKKYFNYSFIYLVKLFIKWYGFFKKLLK